MNSLRLEGSRRRLNEVPTGFLSGQPSPQQKSPGHTRPASPKPRSPVHSYVESDQVGLNNEKTGYGEVIDMTSFRPVSPRRGRNGPMSPQLPMPKNNYAAAKAGELKEEELIQGMKDLEQRTLRTCYFLVVVLSLICLTGFFITMREFFDFI